jgi:hypothetical protein
VYGFGGRRQTWVPAPVFVALLLVAFTLVLYLPTHLVLSLVFTS